MPAANRMTAAELMASDVGDHDELLGNVMRTLAASGYLCHAEPKALAVDRQGREGWRTPTMGPAGWPDIVAVRPEDGRVVAAEIKTGSGRLTAKQRVWFDAWWHAAACNPRVSVWEVRPSNVQRFYDQVRVSVWEVRPSNVQRFYDQVLPLYGEVRP